MSRIRRAIRVLAVGWWFHLRTLTMSSFFILVALLQPVIFASIAFFMFRAGGQGDSLLYAALGAGLMGLWSATLFGSGGAIQWQRWEGTLEMLIGAPTPFLLVLLPLTAATSTVGIYSISATLLWGKLFFDIPFDLVHPALFVLAVPLTVLCLGLLGLVLATSFILYRSANAMSNLLEYPVWLVTGLLVPVSLLPGWTEPIGWVLAPTWGIRAIRESALGGDPAMELGMTLLLGVVYLIIGSVLLKHFERLSLERATLSLS